MATWFLLAFGAAVANSINQAFLNYIVSLNRFSKFTVVFYGTAVTSLILFAVSFLLGFPDIHSGFWRAVLITAFLNFVAAPLTLKAYEIGEFASVYSMTLLTPVFLLFTAFFFLGETPTLLGAFGVILTVLGLVLVTGFNLNHHKEQFHLLRGPLLGALVALIFSVSVNFDKLSAQYSNAFFAGAVGSGAQAVFVFIYLFLNKRQEIFSLPRDFKWTGLLILLPLGIIFSGVQILHNSALLVGFASYTISIKRLGVIFGVVWGWMFFKEKNITRKALGATVAVAGVLAILFA